MTHTKATQIEHPAINLFKGTGWQTLDCYNETFGEDSLLGRDNRSERPMVLLQKVNEKCGG